jgi:hypothetical protein
MRTKSTPVIKLTQFSSMRYDAMIQSTAMLYNKKQINEKN